jgi:hypothetical protein
MPVIGHAWLQSLDGERAAGTVQYVASRNSAKMQAQKGGDHGIRCIVGISWNSVPNMQRAKLMDIEWKNGIRALNGEDMQGVTGRFPDKNGTFHWD